jgi:adenine-specific DNA-methyltransferase
MRYIGSKKNLLHFIEETTINLFGSLSDLVIGDLFSGTACVSDLFKHNGAKIISNDYLMSSFVTQVSKIKLNRAPQAKATYSSLIEQLNSLSGMKNFFYYNYSIEGCLESENKYQRNYFSAKNASKIDAVRVQIENWLKEEYISLDMYYLLLSNLVDSVTKVSNISGTYGAYLKIQDARMHKPLELHSISFFDNKRENECFCEDATKLITHVAGDVLYLDPPYNSRQYPPYYHILETVVKYDNPDIYGKTGRRPYKDLLSPFCIKDKASSALEELITNANFPHILLSYSTEGIIDFDTLTNFLSKIGDVKVYYSDYKRYKSHSVVNSNKKLEEFIIYVKKN